MRVCVCVCEFYVCYVMCAVLCSVLDHCIRPFMKDLNEFAAKRLQQVQPRRVSCPHLWDLGIHRLNQLDTLASPCSAGFQKMTLKDISDAGDGITTFHSLPTVSTRFFGPELPC